MGIFEKFIKKKEVKQEPTDHIANADWIDRYEIELYTIEEAKKYPFSKEGFLKYAEDIFDRIQLETNYQ